MNTSRLAWSDTTVPSSVIGPLLLLWMICPPMVPLRTVTPLPITRPWVEPDARTWLRLSAVEVPPKTTSPLPPSVEVLPPGPLNVR